MTQRPIFPSSVFDIIKVYLSEDGKTEVKKNLHGECHLHTL